MGGDNGRPWWWPARRRPAAGDATPVILTGRPAELRGLVAEHAEVAGLLQVAPAEDTIAMDEGALASWRRPRSSLPWPASCRRASRGRGVAGSTAGVVARAAPATLVPGLPPPALVVVLPTRPRPTFLLDAGAIADPKPEMLLQFAQLGVA